MRRIDLTGKRFGALTALRPVSAAETQDHRPGWLCRCDCGQEKIVNADNLRQGRITSCGCHIARAQKHSRTLLAREAHEDLIGKTYGDLTAIAYLGHNKWRWRCSCGKETVAKAADVKVGNVLSCGHVLSDTARGKILQQNTVGHYDGTTVSRLKHIMADPRAHGIRPVPGPDGQPIAWVARITLRYKQHYIGRYPTRAEAEAARRRAEDHYYKPIIDEYEKEQQIRRAPKDTNGKEE